MDTVCIEGLAIDTLIGIYPHERSAPQPVVFTLALECSTANVVDIAQALDYGAVVAALKAFVAARTDGLLETLAEASAAMLKQTFPQVRAIDLRLDKPRAAAGLGCAHVGIRIRREYA